jgi:hypothetical protein
LPVVAFALALAWARDAAAHQTSLKYIDLVVEGEDVQVTVRLAPGDVTEAMHLPADAGPTVDAAAAHPAVPPYVQRWVALAGCSAGSPSARRAQDRFVAVTWSARCARPRELAIDLAQLFALDARQEAIVQLAARGVAPVQTIVRSATPAITLRAGQAPTLWAWIRVGMHHIYGGLDHVLFVISLLLVVMLYRGPTSWHLLAMLPTLRQTALVVTSFTIAHSLTLIAAALGVISLPGQLVETLIAVSIAYTAVEDVANPAVRWRFWLTFGFGLVHGLGFASQLALMLPPTDVVVPLLCFNVGVELGQLSIVAVALPVLFGFARVLGADRYRRHALPALAAPIVLIGILMVIERWFEVTLLSM